MTFRDVNNSWASRSSASRNRWRPDVPPTNDLSRTPTYKGHLPQARHFHGHQQRQSDSQGDRQQLWLQKQGGSKESQRKKVVPLSDQDGGHCVGCGDPVDEWEAGCQEKGPVEQQTEAPGAGGCE